jgi:tetratricopeptide (TPR) repeat protein
MFRLLLSSLVLVTLFSGCTKPASPAVTIPEEDAVYVDENTLVLFAFDAQTRKDYGQAVGYYDLLYKKTKDNLYRDHAMSALIQGRYYNDVIVRVSSMRQSSETVPDQYLRYLVISLLAHHDIAAAEKEALDLTQQNPTEENYLTLADVYLLKKDNEKTLESLERGYGLNYSEKVLDQIAMLLYTNMNHHSEAIKRLQQHIEHFGYSPLLTKRLLAFYGDQRDEEGLLNTYPRLYDLEPTEQNAGIVIQLYWNANKIPELVQFLESTESNDELLLKIYASEKRFDKAIVLAQKRYDETGEIGYIGQKAIFTYEAAENKRDKKLLDSVISDLTKVVEVKEDGYYLNYLGYCLIEYDRDVEKGIAYVKRALAIEPDSGYFLDSLAWGYYKQGKCEEADELMQRVVKIIGADDEEVKAHLKAIRKCKKGKK